MHVIKKTITKDDGRALYYYHFPATATAEEKQVFDKIEGEVEIIEETEETADV